MFLKLLIKLLFHLNSYDGEQLVLIWTQGKINCMLFGIGIRLRNYSFLFLHLTFVYYGLFAFVCFSSIYGVGSSQSSATFIDGLQY